MAIGQFADGYVSIGQFAFGRILGIGQFSIAPLAIGQFSLALLGLGQVGVAAAGVYQIGATLFCGIGHKIVNVAELIGNLF